MSLAITEVPDIKYNLGQSGLLYEFQLQPGTADYPAGGYPIPASAVLMGNIASAVICGQNLASVFYQASFVFPSGSFGATPSPASSINLVVTAPTITGTVIGPGPVSATTSTAIGVTSNVITVTQVNTLVPGQFVLLKSFTAGGAINGTIVQVLTASPTQFTAAYPTPNITAATADVTGTYQIIQAGAGNQLTTGAVANITNSLATSSLLTMTCANSFTAGQFVIIQGLTNGATSNGVIVQIASASATQFTANWTGTSFTSAADVGTASLLVTSGNAPVTTDISASITNSVATASSAGTAGVITLTAQNGLQPGNIVVIQGLTNGAAINGDLLVVNAAGLSTASFVANHKTAAITTGADSGTATLLVTGVPTGPQVVSPGTDLSACTWFADVRGW